MGVPGAGALMYRAALSLVPLKPLPGRVDRVLEGLKQKGKPNAWSRKAHGVPSSYPRAEPPPACIPPFIK